MFLSPTKSNLSQKKIISEFSLAPCCWFEEKCHVKSKSFVFKVFSGTTYRYGGDDGTCCQSDILITSSRKYQKVISNAAERKLKKMVEISICPLLLLLAISVRFPKFLSLFFTMHISVFSSFLPLLFHFGSPCVSQSMCFVSLDNDSHPVYITHRIHNRRPPVSTLNMVTVHCKCTVTIFSVCYNCIPENTTTVTPYLQTSSLR